MVSKIDNEERARAAFAALFRQEERENGVATPQEEPETTSTATYKVTHTRAKPRSKKRKGWLYRELKRIN